MSLPVDVLFVTFIFCFFKQKTAYEMRISDWSSDVCSSDLLSRMAAGACRLVRAGRGERGGLAAARRDAFARRRAADPRWRLVADRRGQDRAGDRKSTRLNSSH